MTDPEIVPGDHVTWRRPPSGFTPAVQIVNGIVRRRQGVFCWVEVTNSVTLQPETICVLVNEIVKRE